MAYKIEYQMQTIKKSQIKKKKEISVVLIAVCLIAAVFVLRFGAALGEMLLMGEGAVAKDAVEQMVADIKAGESLTDAVTAFCMEIIG